MKNSKKSKQQSIQNKKELCSWCKENNFACVDMDEGTTCDFISLKKEKKAILRRIQQEKEYLDSVKDVMSKGEEEIARVVLDKVAGIQIMIGVLQREFDVDKKEILEALGEKELTALNKLKLYAHLRKMRKER